MGLDLKAGVTNNYYSLRDKKMRKCCKKTLFRLILTTVVIGCLMFGLKKLEITKKYKKVFDTDYNEGLESSQTQMKHQKAIHPQLPPEEKGSSNNLSVKTVSPIYGTQRIEKDVQPKLSDQNVENDFQRFKDANTVKSHDTNGNIIKCNEEEGTANNGTNNLIKTEKYPDIFEARWRQIVDMCSAEGRIPPKDLEHSQLLPNMILELPHSILYCPVEKVASTFWKKTLTAINSMGYFKSPFAVKGKKFIVKTYSHHVQYNPRLNMVSFRKLGTSLLVVRDPYAKVFSAYVDKLFHPNVIFWNHIGKPIEKVITREFRENLSKTCGHKVTFADYVKFLIYKYERNESINTHFTSIASHCDPCVTKYDYIAKLETLRDDVQAIVGKWNETFNLNMQFQDLDTDSALSIAKVHINLALYTKKITEYKCSIPSHMFLLRTWRFLQISGIISKYAEFPTNWYKQSFQQNTKYLLTDVVNVLRSNTSWSNIKRQRKEAMLQAYSTVSQKDMHKLRDIVKADCRYFGYNDMPDNLFYQSTSILPSDFDYFDAVK